jgi:drug/metabolite transporter (DMT)-like permease
MAETPAPLPRRDHVDAFAAGAVVALCALWGVQQVAVKLAAAGGLGPVTQAGLRSAGAAVLVGGWIAVKDGAAAARLPFRLGEARVPALAIAVLFALEFLCLFPGLRLTTASRGVIFLYTAPFFTAVGAHLFVSGERLRWVQLAGLLVAFAGVGATFAEGLAAGGGSIAGDLLCLAGGALWGATTVVVKASRRLMALDSARILFLQLAGSAPLLIAAALAMEGPPRWQAASAVAWTALFYQTAIVAFASYLLWFWMIVRYPAGRLAGFTFLTPLFGILAGHLMLGEPLSPALFGGLIAIAAGLRLINVRAPQRRPA